jgi:hypothetical protein
MLRKVRPVPAVIATVFGAYALVGLIARLRFWDFDPVLMYLICLAAVVAIFCAWVAMRSHLPTSRRYMEIYEVHDPRRTDP